MSKIIVTSIQNNGSSPVFNIPTTLPSSAGGLLQTDLSGNLSFTNTPTLSNVITPTIRSGASTTNFTLPLVDGTTGQFLQTNGSGVLSFVSVSMYGSSVPTTSTAASIGIVYVNTATNEYFICLGLRSGTSNYMWMGSQGTTVGIPQGQQVYSSAGTYSFTVPSGINAISAVAVGGGGGGSWSWASSAGGGGALAYANNIAVTPGSTVTIVVGAGGTGGSSSNGGSSYLAINGTTLFTAQGGAYGATSTRAAPVSGSVTCYGGQGGLCSGSGYGGGGGAGGYGVTTTGSDAQGGDGSYGGPGSGYGAQGANGGNGTNGSGAGGIGYQSSTYGFGGGGGGVGLLGRGNSGLMGSGSGNTFYTTTGGGGGSGGDSGAGNSNSSQTINGTTYYSGAGGKYGGGGGGSGTSLSGGTGWCNGGTGGVRIMWGVARSYPLNATDVTAVS
jgi:hypothetical protein